MDLPERLKDQGDAEEDVLQPQGLGGGTFLNMNQSIFGLIAAAGSKVDFTDRFDGQSSDEEGGDHDDTGAMAMTELRPGGGLAYARSREGNLAQTTVLNKTSDVGRGADKTHRRKFSDNKLIRSVPGLSRLATRVKSKRTNSKSSTSKIQEEDEEADNESSPQSSATESPSTAVTPAEGRHPPVMSRMLDARVEMASRPSFDLNLLSGDQKGSQSDSDGSGPTELAKRLKDIFLFDEAEDVIEEYPCWLLQHVLLQGYMYITTKHIAFYAYLPKKANETIKSGYLSKSGKRNPKFHRYWFRLRGDVLSYYLDSQDLYFPHGQIDLRYAISAEVTDKDKDGVHFSLMTDQRTYKFRADSAPSAKEWVKCLQRVIFRSHNEGDSVKISLPIENVIDVEEQQMLEFADTCKIRVIDNDETYAIDEYFFSFFGHGKQPFNLLKILVDGSSSHKDQVREPVKEKDDGYFAQDPFPSSDQDNLQPPKIRTNKLAEGVKATLSPLSPLSPRIPSGANSPRASGDLTRSSFDAFRPFHRRSLDVSPISGLPRRSFTGDGRREDKGRAAEKESASDSYVQSLGDPSQASISGMVASGSDDPSASQILRGSDFFQSPTIRRSESETRALAGERTAHTSGSRTPASGVGQHHVRHAATTGHLNAEVPDDSTQAQSLQTIAKAGAYPLQRAGAFADYLSRHSRRMSNLLATESMGYVEKVSGMWKGGKRHYAEPSGLKSQDVEELDDDPKDRLAASERFRAHFALPDGEKLQASYFGHLMRVLPLYGKIYLSDNHFCFRSLLPGTRTKLILPLKDIENVEKEKGFRFAYQGLVVVIRGHEELFFEFRNVEIRDDCAITLIRNLEAARYLKESGILPHDETESAEAAVAERDALRNARLDEYATHEMGLPRDASGLSDAPTILFDDPKASFLDFKPTEPMRITCLTIGSRGDVQPYIALCKGLMAEGHQVKIATHAEFKDWIEGHGIKFGLVGGDPGELMRLCIENGTFTWAFLKEANSKFRGWLDELLATCWTACQDSDLLIESPSAMAGIHIAEALNIPYFRAFTMPWTRTRAYPHAFIMPGQKMGGAYNYMSYVMFDTVFWKATARQVNRWRNDLLKLPNTNLEKLQPNKVPFLYNFSPYVVPPPLDYSDWIRVTGYWFLDEGHENYQPPKELTDFIQKARDDGKKLVYVGFGSIIVPDPAKMTQEVIDAVLKADVRCILSKGWSDRMEPGSATITGKEHKSEPVLPPEIFQIKSAPHDWLFAQIDAAAHHGGSGTTGASLRAGIPTIVRPFFGDQFFFGMRVEDLGVGICLKKWGAQSFARALWEATHSERMITKAGVLGEQIRKVCLEFPSSLCQNFFSSVTSASTSYMTLTRPPGERR